MKNTTTPVLFISHGAPTFAIEPGVLGPRLTAVGEAIADVAAVLVVSAHWFTRGVQVATTATPETIHDFGGFPAALYALRYPAAGAPEQAAQAARLLAAAGFAVGVDSRRGIDHGAWVPLRFLYPRADVPVFQVSLPFDLDPAGALRLGKALAPLREQHVLIVGSGSLTHNLSEFRPGAAAPAAYAQEFSDWIRRRLLAGDTGAVVDYRQRAPHAARAHPTEDHFLPLLVALGAALGGGPAAPAGAGQAVDLIEGGIVHGMLSMDSFAWGLTAGARDPISKTAGGPSS